MADVAFTMVINKAIEIGANQILETSTRLHQLPEKIKWIERQMTHFQSCLKDAETKEFQSREVANLINEMRDLALDIEDLLDTYIPKIESHKQKGPFQFIKRAARLPCYAATANTFALEIEKIKKRAEEIEGKREKCGIIANTNSGNVEDDVLDERRRFLISKEPIIVGREEIMENLKQEVLNENSQCKKICVVGEGGIGKTTVVKQLYRDIEKEFECSAMVCVSMEPKVRELLLEIAQEVGLENDKREQNLEKNLQSLLEHKKYLIVLDDIWHTKPWDDLKNIIPTYSKNGSRIIITSRYTDVGRHIGGESSLKRLEVLNGEKSWELFVSLLENDGETCDELNHLEPIGREIVKKCAGVPLAISVVVGMLRKRKRSKDAWGEVLTSMSSSGGENDYCLSILSLSYKDLPMDLRPLFLYFGVFPEDREIEIEELAIAWVAEKLIEIKGTQMPQRVVAAKLEKLYDRNLIQVTQRGYDDRIIRCRIHDVLRSLCISIAEKNNFYSIFQNIDPTNSDLNLRRLTLADGSISEYFLSNFRAPKLRSSICYSYGGGPSYLPEQIGNLGCLTYIKLSGSFYTIPSSIWNLKKLQTFDVSGAFFSENERLIPTSVFKNRSLKHIFLSRDTAFVLQMPRSRRNNYCWSSTCENHDEVFLPNLESLVDVYCYDVDAVGILRKLSKLRNLKLHLMRGEDPNTVISTILPTVVNKLQQLELLTDIEESDHFDGLNLLGYQHLLQLNFAGITGQWIPIWKPCLLIHTIELPPNLIELSFCHNKIDDDVMKGIKGLPKLEILRLIHCEFTNSELDLSSGGGGGENYSFPELQVLIIDSCLFRKLIVDDQAMPTLRKFVYRQPCYWLEYSPDPADLPDRMKLKLESF